MTHPDRRDRIERDRRDRGTASDQPRMCWVKGFRSDGHELDTKPFVVPVDFTPGVAAEETSQRLDALLYGLTVAGNVRTRDVPGCYLEVRDMATPAEVLAVWPVTWVKPQ